MHFTLACLLAAGHIIAAQEAKFSYSPRETTSDDNLATITTLVDGHLPTCFTNHPTHPCPTDGPDAKRDLTHDLNDAAHGLPIEPVSMTAGQDKQSLPTTLPEPALGARDAPLKVDKNYIPHPSEWAIPQDFTFTDTISNATESQSTSSSKKSSATASPASENHLNSKHNYINRDDTYVKKSNASVSDALSESLNATATTAAYNAHSSSSTEIAPSITSHATIVPSIANQENAMSNSSSEAHHLTGSIGTLLSAAMFPGKMRAPTPITPQASAHATTQAPSSVESSIVPIPMSQRPNTTAPDASLQAFVHTINTDNLAASQQTTSSDPTESVESSVASPTATPKSGEKLHHYLHSVELQKPTTASEDTVSTASVTPVPSAAGNGTQAVTRINSAISLTLEDAKPTATPKAHYKRAHHHPMARRFIS